MNAERYANDILIDVGKVLGYQRSNSKTWEIAKTVIANYIYKYSGEKHKIVEVEIPPLEFKHQDESEQPEVKEQSNVNEKNQNYELF